MAKVTIKDLTKRFGVLEAVKNLSLTVEEGEFVVLLGPSGCGKTTTLRCIAGLEYPDEGEIYFDGELVNDLSPSDRNVAFVFQFYALYPYLNVYDNIAFPLRAEKVPEKEVKERVNRILKLLRIEDIKEKSPRKLTSGQAQRVALGRAIVRRPRAFLLDEPLSNLDAKFREEMRLELRRLQTHIGATTLYVTHDQAEAVSMADRIVVMNLGVVQQIGTPKEVYNHPRNLFVANFIGSPGMNFLNCVYREGKLVEESNLFTIALDKEIQKEITGKVEGKKLVLGVRPEDIIFTSKNDPQAILAEVYVVEPLGTENIINLKIGEYIIKARCVPSFLPKIGEKVWVKVKRGKLRLFDRETEENIL